MFLISCRWKTVLISRNKGLYTSVSVFPRWKRRDVRNNSQSTGFFKLFSSIQKAAVHHFDWQLGGGLWRADESKKPISASEATAAVLCSPAHIPPPPPALLPTSHCLLQALLPSLLPTANKPWTLSNWGTWLFALSRALALSMLIQ